MARSAAVGQLHEGCGRMQNRLATFENGSKACCRYRHNADQIQGDIYSFHLARLLGLGNVPSSTLTLARAGSPQWQQVRPQLALAQWREDKPVVVSQYVSGLEPAFIPPCFRTSSRKLQPVAEDMASYKDHHLAELAQWSDLIIFDYLTANLDRVVNNMYNERWNPSMMEAPAHNLARVPKTGLLVFLDNESGLLHGYRLLPKYASYHEALLNSLCIFRRPTVRTLRTLHRQRGVGAAVLEALAAMESDVAADWLPPLPPKSVALLDERVANVLARVEHCQRLYNGTNQSVLPTHQDT